MIGVVAYGAASLTSSAFAFEEGVWTNHDWLNSEEGVGIKNGQPYGQDTETQRRIESATLQSGPSKGNHDKDNVRRIMEVFSEEDFEHLFPMHDRLYDYDAFVVAAGLYPKFCNESDPSLGLSDSEVCKRELSTLFAHIIYETNAGDPENSHETFRQGLKYVKDHHCGKYPKWPPFDGPPECDFHSHGWSAKTWPS